MKKNNVKPKEAVLSKSEQDKVNKEWERNTGEKLNGENAKLDQTAYDAWRKTGKLNGTYTNGKSVTPAKQKPEPVTAKLPTRKLTSTPVNNTIVKPKAAKAKEEAPKFTPTPGTKKLTGRSGSRTGNVATAVKNAVGKQVFKSEVKKSAAFNRATSAAGTGSLAGMDKTDRRNELKGQIKDLKSARKTNKTDVKAELKDTRKALKWSNKVGSSKNQYLNIYGKKK